jgi:hypothetical protein
MDVIVTFGICDNDPTFDNCETTVMTTGAQSSSTLLYHLSLNVDLDVERKTVAVQQLVNLGCLTVKSVRIMATPHKGVSALTSDKGKKSAADMKAEFLGHLCSDSCLISSEHVINAGLTAPPLSEYKFLMSARILGLRLNSQQASLKRKRVEDSGGTKSRSEQERMISGGRNARGTPKSRGSVSLGTLLSTNKYPLLLCCIATLLLTIREHPSICDANKGSAPAACGHIPIHYFLALNVSHSKPRWRESNQVDGAFA